MDTRENLECRALLAASGEARLDDDARRHTAAWSRDLDALAASAREAFAGSAPAAAPALGPAARLELARRRRRFRHLRLARRMAAAAALALIAGGALLMRAERREQTRLERLGNVLFLIRDADVTGAGTLASASPVTLEDLAEQLRQMQFVSD